MTKRKIDDLNDVVAVAQYLRRIGAEVRSLRAAVVKEIRGAYWKDLAVVYFNTRGEVTCPEKWLPTEDEQKSIIAEFDEVVFPKMLHIESIQGTNPPPAIKNAASDDIYEFRGLDGQIIMLQVRIELRDGGKVYHPYTYWDDNKWRMMEPDGPLPIFGVETIGDYTTVFIHEGAKAARMVSRMVHRGGADDVAKLASHPWGEELKGAAHLGWIGGALSPHRTDWSQLKKLGVTRAYIVADNDENGRSAVPAISFGLNMLTFLVQFGENWPVSFDLADEFPSMMFGFLDGERRYVGPSFHSALHPATWATDAIPQKKGAGRPAIVLREHFKLMWVYVEEADVFVCREVPGLKRDEKTLNAHLAPFSHVSDTARLIVKAFDGFTLRLCYRPDEKGRTIISGPTSAINMHVPPDVRSHAGNPKPFLDFIEYMFPHEIERHHILRWCATLIAKPGVRMGFGLLLVTTKQGIGKTTLGSNILAPLVGLPNTHWPTEEQISNSQFTGWVANKRLLVINEIYSGHSWKAYNRMKGIITDKEIDVNEKYTKPYTIENASHTIACSNSSRALKMEDDDRRWFYPVMAETPWPGDKFIELRNWLAGGGLGIIKHWAENFGHYVAPSERSPMTARKQELIDDSKSEALAEAIHLAESLGQCSKAAGFTMSEIVAHVRASIQGRNYETDLDLRKAMEARGCHTWEERIKIGGRLQPVIINEEAKRSILKEKQKLIAEGWDQEERWGWTKLNCDVRNMVIKINEIAEHEM